MKNRLSLAGIVACLWTITFFMVGCNYDARTAGVQPPADVDGESLLADATATAIAASPVSNTGILTAESPINYGPFRIIPSNHPESEIFYRKVTPDPKRTFTQINTIADARKNVLRFKEPAYLPEGLALAAVEGVLPSDGDYYVTTAYRGQSQQIMILQMPVRQTPIPVSNPVKSAVQDMRLGQVGGNPAVFLVPTEGRPATNPRRLRWIQEGVDLQLDAFGFPDMDTPMRVASSLR